MFVVVSAYIPSRNNAVVAFIAFNLFGAVAKELARDGRIAGWNRSCHLVRLDASVG